MRKFVLGLTMLFMGCMLSGQVLALPVYSIGEGNSVTTVNYSASFNSIYNGMSLLGYTENNLRVSVDDLAFISFTPGSGFDDNFHYGAGGNYSYVSICTADYQDIYGLEFLLGSGWYGNPGYMAWEIYDDGISVGSGNSGFIQAGTVVGWSDLDGFDELRVGFSTNENYVLGQFQAIVLDNLNVQTESPTRSEPVPEPASMMLLSTGLIGFFGSRLRKKK